GNFPGDTRAGGGTFFRSLGMPNRRVPLCPHSFQTATPSGASPMTRQPCLFTAVTALFCWTFGASSATAGPVFFFNSTAPYRSSADIPSVFYAGGSPTALENFEDGTL